MATDTTVANGTDKTSSQQQRGVNSDDAAEVNGHPPPTIQIDEKPAPGQIVVYEASSLEAIRISFHIDGAMVKETDGNLTIYFQDESVIIVSGATISQLRPSPDHATAPIEEPASALNPVDAPPVDLSGSGFSELIVGSLRGTSLTRTGPLSDLEFDRVWFHPVDENVGPTHYFQGTPDDLRGAPPDPSGNPDNGNRPPRAAGDSLAASEDGTVTIPVAILLANDRDGDGDALGIVSVQDAVNGTVLLSGTNVIFTPAVDYHGPASFTYTVSDGRGASATARVDLAISSVNDPPQGADTIVATAEDTPFSLAVANFGFWDPRDSPADSLLAVTITSLPTNGALLLNGMAVSAGQSIAVADIVAGALVFQPAPNASGPAYASFTFRVQDNGGTANGGRDLDPSPTSVAIAVTPVNDPPLAQDDAFVTDEDTALAGNVLANDSDVEGPLAVSLAAAPANGSLTLNPDGSFTYTPDPDFNGADAFGYTITDGAGASDGASVAIAVTPVNDPPLAQDDAWAVSAGSAMTVATSVLLANDSDPEGGPLILTAVGNASNGAVVLAGTTVTYAAGAAGAASFQYTVTDPDGAGSTGVVSVTNVQVTNGADTIDISGLGASRSLIDGRSGNDVIIGGVGVDSLVGGGGNDTLDGGAGADVLTGGAANDTYVVDDIGDNVIESAGGGTDLIQSSLTWTLGANVENLTLIGSDAIDGTGNTLANVITGNGVDNRLDGGDGDDILNGGAGDDTLVGGAGNDTLDGGASADTMVGGGGDDTYVVDDLGDLVLEAAAEGTDLVQSSVTLTLSASVENLTLTGNAAINGTGNDLGNVMLGNAAANTLDGGAGNDMLSGGNGDDIILGGLGDDAIDATGGGGNDAITGGAGADTINVSGGNDRLLYLSTGDALDMIIGFDKNSAGGQDFVDLDALFDSLGVAAASRAGRVQFVDTGADVQVRIDADGNAVNGFELTLLTFQGMPNVSNLIAGSAATDDIQVGS